MEKVHELISIETIQKKVKEIGERITKDYEGKDIAVVCVLKGAVIFLSDLLREIKSSRLTVEFIRLSSYEGGTKSTGVVKVTSDLTQSVQGKHLIIVEDIVDTGLTLHFLTQNLMLKKPESIEVCTLLEKPSNIAKPITIKYKCFEIPDKFVIGYGLDYEGRYRNLPYIGVLEITKD